MCQEEGRGERSCAKRREERSVGVPGGESEVRGVLSGKKRWAMLCPEECLGGLRCSRWGKEVGNGVPRKHCRKRWAKMCLEEGTDEHSHGKRRDEVRDWRWRWKEVSGSVEVSVDG